MFNDSWSQTYLTYLQDKVFPYIRDAFEPILGAFAYELLVLTEELYNFIIYSNLLTYAFSIVAVIFIAKKDLVGSKE